MYKFKLMYKINILQKVQVNPWYTFRNYGDTSLGLTVADFVNAKFMYNRITLK